MSKDALKKFRPSSGMPNIKQKFKRIGYFADGGDINGPTSASDVMDASDTISGRPGGMVTPSHLAPNVPDPTNSMALKPFGMKRGGSVRGCGAAIKGKTKGRMV
jgi:hypothetical protein